MLALAVLVSAALDCAVAPAEGARAEAAQLFHQGQQALLESRFSDAEEGLQRALALDPLHPLAHYGLGQAYMELKRYPDAAAAFSRSREAFSCAAGAADLGRRLDEEIRALRDEVRRLEARRGQEGLIDGKEVNGDPRTSADRMREQLELERRLLDLERFRKTGGAAPTSVTLALGTAHFRAGSLPDAEREFRAALAADPRSGDAHNNLAVVLMLTDRLDEAEREARLAAKHGVPVNPRLLDEIKKRRRP